LYAIKSLMTDDLSRIAAALAARYAIERELGQGGMATVYLARDLKHERRVAVKVLRPELTAAVGPERFLREIQITAQLNHPHILALYDSGEADGVLYYVMPYVAGGSLRQHLRRDARLPLDAVLHITQQVAAALDHAHRHGVIHRDVKPENILFSEGHAIVADFGIARAVSAAGRETLTRTGVPLGTPGYMSPEQAMGITELDERTDVYSLACVVYEMLVGAAPVMLPTPEDARLGRFTHAPPDHRSRLDDLPGRVEQALVRALAVQPGDRFATPGTFAEALAAAARRGPQLSDEQVRRILSRAAQLQAENPTVEGALSIGAVEQIAAEVGIPPEHVRQAVAELQPPQPARWPRVLGSAARPPVPACSLSGEGVGLFGGTLQVDRTVEGELSESLYARMVEEIEARLGTVGHVSTLAGSFTWSAAAAEGASRVVVMIKRHEGRTSIRLEERVDVGPRAGLAFGPWVALGALAGGGAGGDGIAVVVLAGLFALTAGLPTLGFIMSNFAERRRAQLEALGDRLAALAGRQALSADAPDA
jgi:tRNA A-37 threonylcarbamoyl transferase component Bud32